MRRTSIQGRPGVAAVETAVVLPFLLMMLAGIWVVGRMIEVHQTLANAAREGARMAAQGSIIQLDNEPVDFRADPDLRNFVANLLEQAGIDATGLIVKYANPDFVADPTVPDGSENEPFNAKKGNHLTVMVRLPHANVRLPVIGRLPSWALPDPDMLVVSVHVQSARDDPFELQTDLPTWNGY